VFAGVAVVVCHIRLRRVHVIDFPAPPPFAAFDIQAQNLCGPHGKHKQNGQKEENKYKNVEQQQ